jgi:hypothetical protein
MALSDLEKFTLFPMSVLCLYLGSPLFFPGLSLTSGPWRLCGGFHPSTHGQDNVKHTSISALTEVALSTVFIGPFDRPYVRTASACLTSRLGLGHGMISRSLWYVLILKAIVWVC